MAAIARRYYVQGRSKKEIAREFGISRFRVARVLQRARQTGIVEVHIRLPGIIDAELSDRLRCAYRLRRAIVVTASDVAPEILREQIGQVGANLLSEIVVEGDVLGIGWGRTITSMTACLKELPRCTVVQLTGAIGAADVLQSSIEMVRRVAAVSGGPSYPIYAPLFVDTPETAEAIRRQTQTREAFRLFGQITKAVVAIGSWDPPDSQIYDAVDAAEREKLRSMGVRAELCSTFVDDDGHAVPSRLTECSIAITGEQLQAIPDVVALAGGRTKAAAIRAVLTGGYATSLVTDTDAARALLDSAPEYPDEEDRVEPDTEDESETLDQEGA